MHLRTARKRLDKHGILGFHSFRRFWTTRRRDIGCPEDIIRFWVGHAGEGITDRYSKLAENVELRKKWALRAGRGFSLDLLGKPGTQHGKPSAKVAKPKRNGSPQIGETAEAGSDPAEQDTPKLADGQEPIKAAVEADVIVPANAGSPLPQHISEISKAAVKAAPAEPYVEPYQASDDDLDASFFEDPKPGPTQEEIEAELARLEELRMILDGVN